VFGLIEPSLFERVVYNLVDNAAKYSPVEKPVEVAIFDAAGKAWIEVRDRGSGVEPEELNLIFSSFYRSPRTSDKVAGKGLGLAVCRRLLDAMRGEIEAEPRDGGGLVVRCSVPLATNP
jgi:two-component system sensor histidine kinase KdpD